MTLRIDLRSETEEALRARAEAAGITVDDCARKILERELGGGAAVASQDPARSLLEDLLGPIAILPPEAFEGLPRDGAGQHDHYIYGTPKRNDL
jgi:hypothetical protein